MFEKLFKTPTNNTRTAHKITKLIHTRNPQKLTPRDGHPPAPANLKYSFSSEFLNFKLTSASGCECLRVTGVD